MGHKNLVVGSV